MRKLNLNPIQTKKQIDPIKKPSDKKPSNSLNIGPKSQKIETKKPQLSKEKTPINKPPLQNTNPQNISTINLTSLSMVKERKRIQKEAPIVAKSIEPSAELKKPDDFDSDSTQQDSSSPTIEKCPLCKKDIPKAEFIDHSIKCINEFFQCKICEEIVNVTNQKKHLLKFNNNQYILEAITKGNYNEFKNGYNHGFKKRINDIIDKTTNECAVHLICRANQSKMLELITKRGSMFNNNKNNVIINIEVLNKNKETPLIVAIGNKSYECVKILLLKGAEVNVKNKEGMTPLMICAKDGNIEIFRLLMIHGGIINEKNVLGKTAYQIAESEGLTELCDVMREEFNAKLI